MHWLQKEGITGRIKEREVRIRLQEWTVMAMGEGHLILENGNASDELYWKVISICIHDIEPPLHTFQRLYFEIIEEMPGISQYLLQRELIHLDFGDRQVFREFLRGAVKGNVVIGQDFVMHLAENLNRTREDWQYLLEFKPKTALPDKYSIKFIQKISQKSGVQTLKLHETLNTRPIFEKTRWFKKNASRKSKKNMNPLGIFSINSESEPNIIQKLNRIHNFTGEISIQRDRREPLNHSILQQLKKSNILQSISRLQLLFTGPNEFSNPQFSQIWSRQQDKQSILSQLKKSIMQALNRKINIFNEISQLLSSSAIQQSTRYQDETEILMAMFKFLISWSWRDVSLFIRLKTNAENTIIEDIDFKIIDYQLKQSSKLKETLIKDEIFLMNYLEYLGRKQ